MKWEILECINTKDSLNVMHSWWCITNSKQFKTLKLITLYVGNNVRSHFCGPFNMTQLCRNIKFAFGPKNRSILKNKTFQPERRNMKPKSRRQGLKKLKSGKKWNYNNVIDYKFT